MVELGTTIACRPCASGATHKRCVRTSPACTLGDLSPTTDNTVLLATTTERGVGIENSPGRCDEKTAQDASGPIFSRRAATWVSFVRTATRFEHVRRAEDALDAAVPVDVQNAPTRDCQERSFPLRQQRECRWHGRVRRLSPSSPIPAPEGAVEMTPCGNRREHEPTTGVAPILAIPTGLGNLAHLPRTVGEVDRLPAAIETPFSVMDVRDSHIPTSPSFFLARRQQNEKQEGTMSAY